MKITPEVRQTDVHYLRIEWENEFEEATVRQILQGHRRNDYNVCVGLMFGNVLCIEPILDKKNSDAIHKLIIKDRNIEKTKANKSKNKGDA